MRIKKNNRFLFGVLIIYLLVALLSGFIANDKPLLCKAQGSITFPLFSDNAQKHSCDFQIGCLIPYSYDTIDNDNRNKSPFDQQSVANFYHRHWLGTDILGRDVLAGIIHGAKISFWVGFASLSLALFIGIIMGFLSGMLSDNHFKIHAVEAILFLLTIGLTIFYWSFNSFGIAALVFCLLFLLLCVLHHLLDQQYKNRNIPFDWIIMRLIEIFKSIPALFLLLILVTLFNKPSYWNVILIIGLTSWPGITRLLRSELMNVKTKAYYTSALATGQSHFKIFLKHGLPNAIQPIIISLAFGFTATILVESSLSFLGIGIPSEEVSWGSMLSDARTNIHMWWMALFPGLAIFVIVIVLNKLGDDFSKPKNH